MGATRFYHLTQSPLEKALQALLERSLQAGWQVVVRGRDAARMDWLDRALWQGPDDGFLPHGLAGGPMDARQPVLLTTGDAAPNAAACVMSVDGAAVDATECAALERVCILFDGNDPEALARARTQWKELTSQGVAAEYWSEESGRWQMKTRSPAVVSGAEPGGRPTG